MDEDINPTKILPKPYVLDQENTLLPKLNLAGVSSRSVRPDPTLEITPLKPCIQRNVVQKSNNKNFPCKTKACTSNRKENVRVELINPWCATITNKPQWTGYDHLRGRKFDKNYRTTLENSKALHKRRPTFYNSVCPKSDVTENDSKQIMVHVTATEAEKLRKPEFNSCLKLAEEIKNLKMAKRNVDNEISKQIKSEKMRQDLSEKASVHVNIHFDEHLYKDLIPIDVSPSEVAMRLQEEKEMKMRACKPQPRPRDPEPSISDFYSDSIYHEHCNIHLEIPRLDLNFPEKSPNDWTFRYYKGLNERNEPF